MAFTKIVSPGIDTTGSYTVQELNTVGVMTAGTVQVGSATTVHTTGIDLGSGNITSHNINSTGIITATSFVGPVTGNITGDITATSGTFSGNVSIGGTLTYEDVTNVDSVGLITARDGIILKSSVNNQQPKLKIESYGEYGEIKADGNGSLILDADPDFNSNDSYIGFKVDGSEKARITSAGLIGIGTANPSRKLHINSGSTDTAMLIESTDGDVQINLKDANSSDGVSIGARGDDFYVRTGLTTERFRVTSDGHVNIGGASPSSTALTVKMATNKHIGFSPSQSEVGNVPALVAFQDNGSLTDIGFRGTTFRVATASAERLRISSTGKVGINTASPRAVLDIEGNAENFTLFLHSNDANANLQFSDNSGGARLLNYGGDLAFRTGTNAHAFGTGDSEALRLTSGGKLATNGASSIDCGDGGMHLYLGDGARNDYSTSADGLIIEKNGNTGLSIDPGSSGTANIYFPNESNHSIASISHNNSTGELRVRGEDHIVLSTNGNIERLRIDSDGNVNIGNKDHHSHNGTVDSLQIGFALNLYEDSYTSGTDNYAIWANNAYYRSGGGNYYMRDDEASRIYQQAGEMWFQNAAAGTAENTISFDTKLRITSGGNFHLSTGELKTAAGDKFAQIRGGGVINTKRLATGNFANTGTYRPEQYGYIGDYMHYGCNAVYFLAQTTTGNSGYSSHMFSWYDSGHWGHYGKFVLMCQESGYIGGMAHRYLSGTTVSTIFGFGNNGSVSTTSTTTGSGTHSGQSVTRYDCTVSHSGTYRTMRWYLGILHGAQLGVTGNGKSQSDCNTYANSNGSLLHLFGVSDSYLTLGPNYRTW